MCDRCNSRLASPPRPFRQPFAMSLDEIVNDVPDLIQIEFGSGVWVHHGGMIDMLALFFDQRPHGELLHIDIGAHQRCKLGRQFADIGRLQTIVVDQARHFHGRIVRQ